MERILSIEETTFSKGGYSKYDGFVITTDTQEIKIGIENGQSCCENWGYFMSQDDLSDFIHSELVDVTITDTELNVERLQELCDEDYAQCMFVNIQTSKGLLQFTAYNEHNGYYGHNAVIISNSLNHSETL